MKEKRFLILVNGLSDNRKTDKKIASSLQHLLEACKYQRHDISKTDLWSETVETF